VKSKFLPVLLLVIAFGSFLVGRITGHGGVAPRSVRPELVEGRTQAAQPAKPIEPPTPEDLKLWASHQELLAEFKFPDPKEMEKMSAEEQAAKIQELQLAQQAHEADAMTRLHKEFPNVKGTDLPLILKKVQEFAAVILPRYYAYQEEEIRRLQAAGAFSDASLPLIQEEALNRLAAEFPSVGLAGIKQLLGVKETP
jgi:hypothetical protein